MAKQEIELKEMREAEKSGDDLLRQLLHMPPQPRPHRERTKAKPGGEPKPAAKLHKRER